MLQNIIERVQRAKFLDEVVLAIPGGVEFLTVFKETSVRPWVAAASQEDDLIGRFYGAAEFYKANIIVRLCADNPCVEPGEIDRAIEYYLSCPSSLPGIPLIPPKRGPFVSYITTLLLMAYCNPRDVFPLSYYIPYIVSQLVSHAFDRYLHKICNYSFPFEFWKGQNKKVHYLSSI